MRTELIFFDSFDESIRGTIRGLIAFVSLIVFDLIWLPLSSKSVYGTVKQKPNIPAAILSYLVLCSAIGVQLPNNYIESLVYGLLVGFVTYSVFNLTSFAIFDWPPHTAIIDIIAGTLNCGIASSFIYLIYFMPKHRLETP
jgi:uncharacterized membrane protein